MTKELTIALAGNPNCGKTTLFNALTGATQYVGNWPGVTVEKKEGRLRSDKEIHIMDLPGIYSLSPYTLEEVVSRNYLVDEAPDVILNIVDASNLERNLYLTTQLLELGLPVVIALNMMDIVEKNGDRIELDALSKKFGVPVVTCTALRSENVDEVIKACKAAAGSKAADPLTFSDTVEAALAKLSPFIPRSIAVRYNTIKLFERDEKAIAKMGLSEDTVLQAEQIIAACEKELDDDCESIITNDRYAFITDSIGSILKRNRKGESTSEKIDRIMTNKFLALPMFAAIMFLVYYISVSTVGTWVTDWANDGVFGEGWSLFGLEIPGIPVVVENLLVSVGCADWLQSLILDGIVAGVGAVLGFVPQILVLFILLAILEDCGYMARVAFIMDRIFRKFGLSGKSFIPMLISTGCGVPGIMASRTIESEHDRKMTVMTTTFMPCSAKLPIISLIAGAMFGNAWWVAPSAYFIGIAAIIISGIMLKKTKHFAGESAPFVMELPTYHMPLFKNVMRSMWERGWSFIKKATTIILLSTVLIWFTSGYGIVDGQFSAVDISVNYESSFLYMIGSVFAWLFVPLGWAAEGFSECCKAAVAAIMGLIAKENVVATFGQLYGIAESAEDGSDYWTHLQASFNSLAAFSFLVFNLLCAPCFAAMAAIKREMNNIKWFWAAIGYQTLLAYVISMVIYHIGSLFVPQIPVSPLWLTVSLVCVAILIYLIVRPDPAKRSLKSVKTSES